VISVISVTSVVKKRLPNGDNRRTLCVRTTRLRASVLETRMIPDTVS